MKRIFRFFIGIGILILVFFIIVNSQANKANGAKFVAEPFVIESGQGVGTIAENLESLGYIQSTFWFKSYVWLKGERASFYDGTFELHPDMSIKEIIETLINQTQLAEEVQIKILEGWKVAEIDEHLVEKGLIKEGELIKYSQDFTGAFALKKIMENDWSLLKEKPITASLEGYLYPDTYRVYKDASLDDIVKKMIDNFHRKVDQSLRDELEKQGKDLFEVMTLASVVEKEMFGYANRQNVADIFQKRLEIGMALQSDATVNYITEKGTTRPSIKDTKIDSLYNTYKYAGLMPGPICNPSIEAIKSVIYPRSNDFWYFLTTPEGDIIYSKTYDEHLINVNKYLN
jgi:UPF0755 protein